MFDIESLKNEGERSRNVEVEIEPNSLSERVSSNSTCINEPGKLYVTQQESPTEERDQCCNSLAQEDGEVRGERRKYLKEEKKL